MEIPFRTPLSNIAGIPSYCKALVHISEHATKYYKSCCLFVVSLASPEKRLLFVNVQQS